MAGRSGQRFSRIHDILLYARIFVKVETEILKATNTCGSTKLQIHILPAENIKPNENLS